MNRVQLTPFEWLCWAATRTALGYLLVGLVYCAFFNVVLAARSPIGGLGGCLGSPADSETYRCLFYVVVLPIAVWPLHLGWLLLTWGMSD